MNRKKKRFNCNSCAPIFRGCIGLRFKWILKDFFMLKNFISIQSRLLLNQIKSFGIQSRQLRFFFQGNEIRCYSIEISHDL
jgi:hypothetical protein